MDKSTCYNTIMWHIYIVRCADNTFYTGITTDVLRRLREHNGETAGGARYTKLKRPVALVYAEPSDSQSHALAREHAIKRYSHAQKEQLVEGAKPPQYNRQKAV